ncbi:nuclear transport factor 2 family protein [Ideonella oryzae]|uniref:Nuclear transport factor 2 family protein n=1 Tax=Ideonella oryzae TaxID=2937441 RepID=A0ABT1BS10_9BURK|nr:nuclear transport factor 2 family protein [Ideonella oryzae]
MTPAPLPVELAGLAQRLVELEDRLERFEDAAAIRACVHRYMALCDRLDATTPMDALLDCFTEDAIWAGKGARYGESFGGHRGRAAIGAMLGAYRGSLPGEDGPQRPPHFAFNAHFLCSELITPTGADTARAEWTMLQTSTFADGRAHLNAAQLTLQMRRDTDGHWRIAHFETENLLSRPVDHWHSDTALPVPRR